MGQKILIVVGVSILLLFFITLMFLITTPKQKITETSSSQPTASDKKLSEIPSASPTPVASLYTYAGNHFQVTYDTDIYSASGNKDNAEDNIIFKQNGAQNLNPFVSFNVQSSSKLSTEKLDNIFSSFKYARSNIVVDGIPAVQYKGSIHINNNDMHDIVYFYAFNNFTYKIQLTYQSPTIDPSIEKNFTDLMKTYRNR